jgi:hypothetical protein
MSAFSECRSIGLPATLKYTTIVVVPKTITKVPRYVRVIFQEEMNCVLICVKTIAVHPDVSSSAVTNIPSASKIALLMRHA